MVTVLLSNSQCDESMPNIVLSFGGNKGTIFDKMAQ